MLPLDATSADTSQSDRNAKSAIGGNGLPPGTGWSCAPATSSEKAEVLSIPNVYPPEGWRGSSLRGDRRLHSQPLHMIAT
jgi:hypothetical protein